MGMAIIIENVTLKHFMKSMGECNVHFQNFQIWPFVCACIVFLGKDFKVLKMPWEARVSNFRNAFKSKEETEIQHLSRIHLHESFIFLCIYSNASIPMFQYIYLYHFTPKFLK